MRDDHAVEVVDLGDAKPDLRQRSELVQGDRLARAGALQALQGVFVSARDPVEHGRLLATASADKTARLWGLVTGEARRTLTGHDGPVNGVAVSPDGRLLATASDDKTARLWD